MLGQHSVPFWSPRYQAHMCTDLSMPALLGYFMTMVYNPNNVTLEASPISTVAEIEVGEQLSHITCDGTVANLESMWVARNLKYYPLSLRKAMDDIDGPLRFVPDTFSVRTCTNRLKSFRALTPWELLNLKLKTILDIPAQLYRDYGITPTWLQGAINSYNIQTVGKGVLDNHFDIGDKDSPQYFVAATRHYSWPKAGAIMGLGSENVVSVDVDLAGRLNIDQLKAKLDHSLKNERPVLAVVAVVGTTEEGAVDPLCKILALRQRFQAQGLSFIVHADSAWSGYFATMLPRDESWAALPGRDGGGVDGLVPDLSLRAETQEDLCALRYCDSVTVDPHKAGYIPYPAGALAYRDGRIKSLVIWTAPYLSQGAETSMGINGVEGSKPGASAVSTWLSHQCIGLDQKGYGARLSEACFTSSRFSALWAALSTPKYSFLCVPFNMLPSEATGSEKEIEEEKQRIRDDILSKTNAQIVKNNTGKDSADKTMTLLRALGSDININLFAVNWRYPGPEGKLNTDVEEANYFMTRIIKKLSVDSPDDATTTIPLYLTPALLEPDVYGECVENYKKRLGLEPDTGESLMVFRNVVMSPLASFSTNDNFINMLGNSFKCIVEKEKRNEDAPDYHSFWIHGAEQVFLSYRSMFNIAKHRQQVILGVELDEAGKTAYDELVGNTDGEIVLKTSHKLNLESHLKKFAPGKSVVFLGNLTTKSNGVVASDITVKIASVIKNRPLNRHAQDDSYPTGFMPFYLYGTATEQHIDHVLLQAPNISLTAGNVTLGLQDGVDISTAVVEKRGVIVTLEGIQEAAMQPFPDTNDALPAEFFFQPGCEFEVKVWDDPRSPTESTRNMLAEMRDKQQPLAKGTLRLGNDVVVDVDKINRDPYGEVAESDETCVSRWRERFSRIGKELSAFDDSC
ncbi:pyridoxal phosphate-dependent transferase [Lasiosphaeria miniovina]|uniref:Pyridoxal phosphate-dependent transferase n=1 Tax=Lasiosphaeria miniovina TaxID=1954250 RepID=A0AA40DV96_9PEZI|nr:pyridoxal phosphate-dependent transferase [Lasiosphaeria miniovina]KAK0716870.1 pyridoxal phosphate-dependent transferase [Lasiosphaeria miniovina]